MRKVLLLSLAVCFSLTSLYAQRNMNLYGLDHLTQAQALNPAFVPDSRFTLGIGIPSLNITYNGFVSTYDIFGTHLTANEHIDLIVNNLYDNSTIAFASSANIFNFGFKAGRSFVTMGATVNVETFASLPPKIFDMLWHGNAKFLGQEIDIDGLGVGVNAYTSLYTGISLPINDKLQVGARFQYLIGHVNMNTAKANGYLLVDSNDYTTTAFVDAEWEISNIPFAEQDRQNLDPMDFVITDNRGYALDLGATYQLTSAIRLSASVLNIGKIKWQQNTNNYVVNGEYDFEGVDANDENFEASDIIDTLKAIFNPQKGKLDAYEVKQNPEIFLGGKYRFVNGHEMGLRLYSRMIPNNFFYGAGFSYKMTLGRWFYLSPSFTTMKDDPVNLGLGVGLRLLGLDLHFIADNMNSLAWYDAKGISMQMGLQFTFKAKKKRSIQPVQF